MAGLARSSLFARHVFGVMIFIECTASGTRCTAWVIGAHRSPTANGSTHDLLFLAKSRAGNRRRARHGAGGGKTVSRRGLARGVARHRGRTVMEERRGAWRCQPYAGAALRRLRCKGRCERRRRNRTAFRPARRAGQQRRHRYVRAAAGDIRRRLESRAGGQSHRTVPLHQGGSTPDARTWRRRGRQHYLDLGGTCLDAALGLWTQQGRARAFDKTARRRTGVAWHSGQRRRPRTGRDRDGEGRSHARNPRRLSRRHPAQSLRPRRRTGGGGVLSGQRPLKLHHRTDSRRGELVWCRRHRIAERAAAHTKQGTTVQPGWPPTPARPPRTHRCAVKTVGRSWPGALHEAETEHRTGEYRVMSGLLINLIIQIISGAVGGNVAANAAKNIDLGTLGNTIAGAVGGGVGGQVLGMLIPLLANSASTPDIGSIIGQMAGGGVAGAIVTAIVGAIKNRTTTA